MPTPHEIARGLTKAQRDLLNLAATSDHVNTLDWRELYKGGLVYCLKPMPDYGEGVASFQITPLGLAVHQL